MKPNKTSASSSDSSGFLSAVIAFSIIMLIIALVLSFTMKNMSLPESLDYMCNDFSEKYNQFFEYENDISSISTEKAYRSKMSLDNHLGQYRYYLDYWSNPNYEAQDLLSDSDEKTKIVIDHVYHKSCDSYWKYTETVRPILEDILTTHQDK